MDNLATYSTVSNEALQELFRGDQQGYLYADLCRIIQNGCYEKITEGHIEALKAENVAQMNTRGEHEWLTLA